MEPGQWVTEVRVEQLGRLLSALRGFPRHRVREDRVAVALFPSVGGQVDDLSRLIRIATDAGCTRMRSGHVVLTASGRSIATQDAQSGGRLLARALINTGMFGDQARVLIMEGEFDEDGRLACPRRAALHLAPQLTSLLRRWPDVVLDTHLRIPRGLFEQVSSLWALLPQERLEPGDEGAKTAVGNRGELYSYYLELETASDDGAIDWVARYDSGLGFDIEDHGSAPSRLIEVKGSRGNAVRFILSPKELEVAQRHPDRYEVQFWGEINLDRGRVEEYADLRRKGYPTVFRDLPGLLASGALIATAEAWVVTAGASPLSGGHKA